MDRNELGIKTGKGLYDYTPERIAELRAERGAQARGGAQGARVMKVWLLDNGSIVIEHTQLLWNVPGPQVRIPVYSVLVESDDGLFLFDTGIDLDHMNRVLPFELPEQTPEQTIPAQLARLRVLGLGRHDARQLASAHRPRRRQQALRRARGT